MKRFLKKLGANSRFRDPIYGYIWLTDKEKKIIDLPLFQRLRRVHQLALTKYVYPTAEHSRFVHSLGAVHCATAMFAGIFQHNDTHTRLLTESEQDRFLGLLRFAALLHDIGHLPFSHGAEKELLGDLGHEDISQYLITKYGPLQSILEDDAQIVSSILSSSTMRQKYKILHEIISGHLDADRADYLMRDSYICGVKYGEYDFERYMQSFGAFKENSSLRLFVNERDIFVVEAFLMARYHYNLQVPYHRTRTGYDLILRRYFRDLQERRLYEEFFKKDETGKIAELDTNFYEDFDDYAVFEQIKKDYRAGNKWAEMLLRQGHLLPVLDITNSLAGNEKLFKDTVSELCKKKGLNEWEDYFITNDPIKLSKFGQVPEEGTPKAQNSKQDTILVKFKDGSYENIADVSKVIKSMQGTLRLMRIYAIPEKRDEIKALCEKVNTSTVGRA